jgi:hypothetical protein
LLGNGELESMLISDSAVFSVVLNCVNVQGGSNMTGTDLIVNSNFNHLIQNPSNAQTHTRESMYVCMYVYIVACRPVAK